MEVEELEEESSETMIEDYKYYRRKLYNHMRYIEKSIEEKNNHSGEENLKECFIRSEFQNECFWIKFLTNKLFHSKGTLFLRINVI